jgi:hypothetical protein
MHAIDVHDAQLHALPKARLAKHRHHHSIFTARRSTIFAGV